MKWTEVLIETSPEASDAISEMLTSSGASGVVIEDPNDIRRQIDDPDSLDYADEEFRNSLGEDVRIKAYFSCDVNQDNLMELIKGKISFISGFLDVGKGSVAFSEVDDEDWATAWKKYYKPFNITDHIVIRPSWEQYEARPGEIIIELDPGMAFGTGTHETTRLCSQLLEKHTKSGDEVIDLGCGTGILSMVAAKLGAKHITAVDIDETAVRVAKENCTINRVKDRVDVFKGVLDTIEKNKADIVVANIIADVIIGIASKVPDYLKEGGYFITSGIIKARKEDVITAYQSNGFKMEESEELGEWVAIVFRWQGSM